MKIPVALSLALLLSGCASSGGATYKHPMTGDARVCKDYVPPSIWTEMFCPPCYHAMLRNPSRDCWIDLEAKGYVRQ